MNNILTLLHGPDWICNGHGGSHSFRTFKIYLNGVMIENIMENTQNTFNYHTGKAFDRALETRVKTLENAARTKCLRATAQKES